ncbi:styrene monooxygenase [Bacillus carboniphilus]|uniref:Styrene monooxygenase n=1 Tax=Bacillus carboniphilus TaxID=86663 RepID=A0ABY9JYI1_9BACI|nr:styrene monooxygenase/indole monooxygenase family protein [Bacillus carboniphilus]WLR43823.1 styrene monooxygenase [Bacillus carboniphilus]
MRKRIAIIGSGVAALHLTYAILKDELMDVTIITKQTPDELRNNRIHSSQVHYGPTRYRENYYGMPAWDEALAIDSIRVVFGGQDLFVGQLHESGLSVDQRYYAPRYMEDLIDRGVSFRYERVTKETLEELVEEFDLVVDCTGRTSSLVPYQDDKKLTTVHSPKRKCIIGYFLGLQRETRSAFNLHILPEVGELFEFPIITEKGPITTLYIEAIPDGDLDLFKGIKTPEDFTEKMKSTMQTFFPEVYERIDQQQFRLLDEKAFMQIAINPYVKIPYTLVNGKLIVGCGDCVVLNDPFTGQGANTASYCAEQLYFTLREELESGWTEQTGRKYWEKINDYVTAVSEWSNASVDPLPEQVMNFLMQATQDQNMADQFVNWTSNPKAAHKVFYAQGVSK